MRLLLFLAVCLAGLLTQLSAMPPPPQDGRAVRIDFEGTHTLERTVAAPVYTPGPPSRFDFQGIHVMPPSPPTYRPAAPLRIDFEGSHREASTNLQGEKK